MKFICNSCGNEKLQNIECHGHIISYKNGQFVCEDCAGKQLSDDEISDCIPKCCKKSMQLND